MQKVEDVIYVIKAIHNGSIIVDIDVIELRIQFKTLMKVFSLDNLNLEGGYVITIIIIIRNEWRCQVI